jgi:hypothetical protein
VLSAEMVLSIPLRLSSSLPSPTMKSAKSQADFFIFSRAFGTPPIPLYAAILVHNAISPMEYTHSKPIPNATGLRSDPIA